MGIISSIATHIVRSSDIVIQENFEEFEDIFHISICSGRSALCLRCLPDIANIHCIFKEGSSIARIASRSHNISDNIDMFFIAAIGWIRKDDTSSEIHIPSSAKYIRRLCSERNGMRTLKFFHHELSEYTECGCSGCIIV